MQEEEIVDQQLGEQGMGGKEVKYDGDFDGGEYTEELAEDFVAMITVECVDTHDSLDVSEMVALARDEHSIHLDSCNVTIVYVLVTFMTGYYNLTDSIRGGKPA